jgi:hypothetical protein
VGDDLSSLGAAFRSLAEAVGDDLSSPRSFQTVFWLTPSTAAICLVVVRSSRSVRQVATCPFDLSGLPGLTCHNLPITTYHL